MRLKLISCDVFYREACFCVATSPHRVDLEFTEKNAHERSDYLRSLLQERIAAAEAGSASYDAILLGFGLCGNGLLGLSASRTRLVLPRAHDCCTIFLGSRLAFKEHFSDNPSRPFSSAGYMERDGSWIHDAGTVKVPGLDKTLEDYIAQYGEENARYIMETLTSSTQHAIAGEGDRRIVFIETAELSEVGQPHEERCRREAEASGRQFVKLTGSLRLLKGLIHGAWDPAEYLVIPPGQKIGGVYDWDTIVRAEPV